MNEPKGFLSRWSRRKREGAEAEQRRTEEIAPAEEAARAKAAEQKKAEGWEPKSDNSPAGPEGEAAEPTFDLSQMPPIESITAATDIRPFLATGVPAELTRAALRRAWVADPKIRDFIEIAENQWDFNAGTPIPGFDLSPPSGDLLKRMVAEIFGEQPAGDPSPTAPEAGARTAASEAAGNEKSTVANAPSHRRVNEGSERGREASSEDSPQKMVVAEQHDESVAAQPDGAVQETTGQRIRRRHGSAINR